MELKGKIIRSTTFHTKPYFTFLGENGKEYVIWAPSLPSEHSVMYGRFYHRKLTDLFEVNAVIINHDGFDYAKIISK